MKKVNRMLALLLAIASLMSICAFSVSAEDSDIALCGTSIPTSAYYLSNGAYTASFSNVAAGIYTSKYFVANDSTIKVKFSGVTTKSSEDDKIAYWLYTNAGYLVESDPHYTSFTKSGGTKAAGSYTFTTSSKQKYYVWFRSHNGSKMSGTITVA